MIKKTHKKSCSSNCVAFSCLENLTLIHGNCKKCNIKSLYYFKPWNILVLVYPPLIHPSKYLFHQWFQILIQKLLLTKSFFLKSKGRFVMIQTWFAYSCYICVRDVYDWFFTFPPLRLTDFTERLKLLRSKYSCQVGLTLIWFGVVLGNGGEFQVRLKRSAGLKGMQSRWAVFMCFELIADVSVLQSGGLGLAAKYDWGLTRRLQVIRYFCTQHIWQINNCLEVNVE